MPSPEQRRRLQQLKDEPTAEDEDDEQAEPLTPPQAKALMRQLQPELAHLQRLRQQAPERPSGSERFLEQTPAARTHPIPKEDLTPLDTPERAWATSQRREERA